MGGNSLVDNSRQSFCSWARRYDVHHVAQHIVEGGGELAELVLRSLDFGALHAAILDALRQLEDGDDVLLTQSLKFFYRSFAPVKVVLVTTVAVTG